MRRLPQILIKTVIIVAAGIAAATAWNKAMPAKAVAISSDPKSIGILAAIVAAGTLLVNFAAKQLRINFLR